MSSMSLLNFLNIFSTVIMNSFEARGQTISHISNVAETFIAQDISCQAELFFHPRISSLGDWGGDRPSDGGVGWF